MVEGNIMSTHYFILTKPNGSKTDDNTHNQIHSMNPAEVHLLPQRILSIIPNMDCLNAD